MCLSPNLSRPIAGLSLALLTLNGFLTVWCATPSRPGLRAGSPGPLRVHPGNPRYFGDAQGHIVYLTGSHTWNNLVDMGSNRPPAAFDYDAFLERLARYPHNFFRLWTWELTHWDTGANRDPNAQKHFVAPLPYARTGPGRALDGLPKFDLERFDSEYFERLHLRIQAARDRGFYVAVMLFEGWGLQRLKSAWPNHPFHPDNNVNGIDGDRDGDGVGVEVHELGNSRVTAIQEAYVRRVIDTVNTYDNVLYEISNENHPASTAWQYHMIRFIKAYEASKPFQHPVGMTFQFQGGSNQTLSDSPADWISPNPEGGYRDNPPPAQGQKVIVTDTDHLWGIGGNPAWVWKSFMRGLNPIFMDPYDGSVLTQGFSETQAEAIRVAMGQTLELSRKINLGRLRPHPKLASSHYCLANPRAPAAEYLVYLPQGGSVTVDLQASPPTLKGLWLNPTTGTTQNLPPVKGGTSLELMAPSTDQDWVLWLSQPEDSSP